jgi:hypothetical protein
MIWIIERIERGNDHSLQNSRKVKGLVVQVKVDRTVRLPIGLHIEEHMLVLTEGLPLMVQTV